MSDEDDLLKIEVRPKWYWRVVSPDGKILSKGPGFDSKDEAIAEARCEIEDSIYKYVLEVIEDSSKTERRILMSDEKSDLWPKIPQDDLGWLKLEVRPSEETGRWYWRIVSPEGKILSKGAGFDSKEEAIAQARWVEEGSIYKYIFEVIEEPAGIEQIFDPQRFPSLRETLKEDFESIRIAKEVIFKKWPELADLLGKNSVAELARLSYMFYVYAIDVVKGPWPEGEAAISSCQKVAATYPKNDAEIVQYAENTTKVVAMYADFVKKNSG